MKKELLKPKVHFISGKGGVGKSLTASALAHFFYQSGYETLLIELSEEESEDYERVCSMRQINEKLFFMKIYPNQALYEYLSLKMPRTVLEKLFSKRFFRALAAAMPALFDLTRLGKIWFHADPSNKEKAQIFDKIVVDLPSSGFIMRFLLIARVVKEVVKVGPLAKEADKIDTYFHKEGNAILHLVALPEELVINETIELYQKLRASNQTSLGILFMNRVVAFGEHELQSLTRPVEKSSDIKSIVNFFLTRVHEQNQELKRLQEAGLLMPRMDIYEQWGEHIDSQIVDAMMQVIKDNFSHE